jgi:allantoinase
VTYPRDLRGHGATVPCAAWPGDARIAVQFVLNYEEGGATRRPIFGVAMALERNTEIAAASVERGEQIACHGWRWIHYQPVDEATGRDHMRVGVDIIKKLTSAHPLGWYTGRDSPNTRRLVVEHGGFVYDAITKATICRSGPK